MNFYTNGIPMDAKFHEAITLYIEKARSEGCTATDAEVFAAFEVLIMDALRLPVLPKTRELANRFESAISQ